MTYQEAHEYIENLQREMTKHRFAYSEELISANGMSILALEKQIPKKPIADKYGIVTICPHCNIRMRSQEIAVDNWGGKHFVSVRDKHCKDCGQALDWSDE